MNIDWFRVAIDNIEVWYECPICNYREHDIKSTIHHIKNLHTQPEIKEFCSQ